MLAPIVTLLRTEVRRVWCHRWLVVGTTLALGAVGAAVAIRMPTEYEAWGQIYVNSQTPLSAATEGVALTGASYGSPYVVQKTLLNDTSLEKVVRKIDPAAASYGRLRLEVAIARLRAKIRLAPDPGEGFVELHVTDTDPVRARDTVQVLMDQFIGANVERTRSDLLRADQFLGQQISAYDALLATSQAKITAFRRNHPSAGALLAPGAGAAPQSISPSAPRLAAAARFAAVSAQVSELEGRLANLRTIYTDEYPDVIATRRQLARAVAERQATPAVTREGGEARAPALRLNLIDPAIAAEGSELQKTDEMLHANHQQLLAKRDATRMSQAVYGADHGKYQVTRRPTVPLVSSGPNRLLHFGLVAAFAICGGLGVGYLRASARDIFVSTQELERALQLPVIGTISQEPAWRSQSRARLRRGRRAKRSFPSTYRPDARPAAS